MRLSAGSRLGKYEVRALLGAGGMGEVYRARDAELDRDVAIKILRDGDGDSRDVRRFVQEARASSSLQHPNVAHVYEIGSENDLRFIVMELVEGETLRARIRRGPMPVSEMLDLGTQVASALAAAHKAGIVHRDIKPENIVVTPDGYAKVLDFGLAKLREVDGQEGPTLVMTRPGVALGTLAYMAPEQLTGGEVGPATDVFALGVVLYEMLVGRRPFSGTSVGDEVTSILTKSAPHVQLERADVPPALGALLVHSLAKASADRPSDGRDVYEQLRTISREIATVPSPAKRSRVPVAAVAAVIFGIAILAAGAWWMIGKNRRTAALAGIERAEKLVREHDLTGAYDEAIKAARVLPTDPRVRAVIAQSATPLSVESDPPGARIILESVGPSKKRIQPGVTPLVIRELPRDNYILTLEKSGYAPASRTVMAMPVYHRGDPFLIKPPPIRMRLTNAASTPPGMVFVDGGEYRLNGYQRPSDRVVPLEDFFIDRYEVSNRDFERFVREGGYRKRDLWKHPFVDGGKTLSFEQAMARFRDATGLPGPREWRGGAPLPGTDDHPVTGVSWYEASAFAAWQGKTLPTIFQWEKAARTVDEDMALNMFPWGFIEVGADGTERANFGGKGTMPVSSLPEGAGPYGAFHMAGNVSEWCRNPFGVGRAARGGSWHDALYAFGQTAALPSFHAAPTLGFRCVSPAGRDDGEFALAATTPKIDYTAVDDTTFEQFRRRYDYARSPLQAKIVERIETADWTREKITYVVAGKTVPAYLYLPKGFPRPLQVVHFAPAGDVVSGWRPLTKSIDVFLAPVIRGGRAVFAVQLEGFIGRPRTHPVPQDRDSEEYVDYRAGVVTEMRRGLDYLETRSDIDRSRIALVGISAGGGPGVFATALESRYRAVFFAGTGIAKREELYAPAANRINFIPRIRAPKMMLHGRYDEDTSLETEAEPMFRLMREPKRMQIYEGGHIAPLETMLRAVTSWLDETMGAV